MNVRLLLALMWLPLLTACGSLSPSHFSTAEPRFEPDRYFEGPTRSWGVTESRRGNPKSRFRTEMFGRREGDVLVVTQDFTFEDGRTQRRLWRIRRIDEHRYEATSPDVPGVAPGEAYGNTFHWEYTLALTPHNVFTRVRMHHWMYLQADGTTMINRVIITKLGVVIAETTEHFHRGTAPVPSIGR
ncbi:MAG: DUF3833 family protein [Acidobacteriota bacterium]